MIRTSGVPAGGTTPRSLAALSPREIDILAGVTAGMTTRKLAQSLGLSERSTSDYIFRLCQGLGLRGRVELMLWALQNPGALAGKPAVVGLHRRGCDCGASTCEIMRTLPIAA